MKAKKNLDSLNKRLGVGDYKSGDKDIKGTYANVKTRLDELEKKRQGLLDREILIDTKEDFRKGTFTDSNANEGVLVLNSTSESGDSNVNLIPPMTSNTTPSGVVSASAELASSGSAWKAFNGTVSSWEDRWFLETFLSGSWLMYQFDIPTVVSAYEIYPVIGDNGLEIPRSPKDFKLFGKNEGTEWVELDARIGITDWTGGVPKRFSFQNKNEYQYYQLSIIANNGDKALEIGELKMFGVSLIYAEQGEWISNEMDLGDDFLELSGIEIVGTGKYKVFTKTNADKDFVEVTGKVINSRHGQKLVVKVQLEKGEVLPTVDSIKIKFKNRPLSDRVSEVEANVHTNLNKHNLRVSSLLNKKRYKLKDMIMDDFSDDTGINLEYSVNLTHDADGHKVKQTDAGTFAVLTTVTEKVTSVPEMILVSTLIGKSTGIEEWKKYPESPMMSNSSDKADVIWNTAITDFKGTQPWQVFDGSEEVNTAHSHYFYGWNNYHVGLDFKNSPKDIKKVYISSASLIGFEVICSNDKTSWKVAYSGNHGATVVNDLPVATPKEYEFNSVGSYRYWAIRIVGSVPDNWHGTINELAFFEKNVKDIVTQDPSQLAGAEFYVSRDNGITWTPVKPDTLTKVNMQPEGKDVVIKIILRDGQELHAMSYSWL